MPKAKTKQKANARPEDIQAYRRITGGYWVNKTATSWTKIGAIDYHYYSHYTGRVTENYVTNTQNLTKQL